MLDWRGTELRVGSRVIYPVRKSSSMWVTEATVVQIQEDFIEKFSHSWWERSLTVVPVAGGRKRKIAYERATVVEPSVRV